MKANEMPERIYLFDYNDAMVTPLEGDTVYVREDAFIEKAVEFIGLNVCDYIDFTHKGGIEHLELQERFIRKFREAMKL